MEAAPPPAARSRRGLRVRSLFVNGACACVPCAQPRAACAGRGGGGRGAAARRLRGEHAPWPRDSLRLAGAAAQNAACIPSHRLLTRPHAQPPETLLCPICADVLRGAHAFVTSAGPPLGRESLTLPALMQSRCCLRAATTLSAPTAWPRPPAAAPAAAPCRPARPPAPPCPTRAYRTPKATRCAPNASLRCASSARRAPPAALALPRAEARRRCGAVRRCADRRRRGMGVRRRRLPRADRARTPRGTRRECVWVVAKELKIARKVHSVCLCRVLAGACALWAQGRHRRRRALRLPRRRARLRRRRAPPHMPFQNGAALGESGMLSSCSDSLSALDALPAVRRAGECAPPGGTRRAVRRARVPARLRRARCSGFAATPRGAGVRAGDGAVRHPRRARHRHGERDG